MRSKYQPHLDSKKRYLQVALNSTLTEARQIISHLPISDRIIIEAGTPLIKRYGMDAVRSLRRWYAERIGGQMLNPASSLPEKRAGQSWGEYLRDAFLASTATQAGRRPPLAVLNRPGRTVSRSQSATAPHRPYIVADVKTMDRGATEVEMVAEAGGSAAIALGSAPVETLNVFVEACQAHGIDAMIDMMNVEYPVGIIRQLKRLPVAVIVHRGVDEERDNREKRIPFHEIQRLKGNYDVFVSIAGGDTPREVQRAIFNDADIVVIWKSVYHSTKDTISIVETFLKDIK